MSSYGAADEEIFAGYKWVIGKRKAETYGYMAGRIEANKKADKDRSCVQKCGSLVKTMMIYGTVAGVVIPILYSLYTATMAEQEKEERMENMKFKEEMSKEDIAKAAMEREAEM